MPIDLGQGGVSTRDYFIKVKARRIFAVVLIVLGAVLMLAAPDTVSGALMMAIGILVEIVGIALEKR